MLRAGRRAANSLPAVRRHYTGTVIERESERAEFASGLLAKVGGKRLSGAGFEVRSRSPRQHLARVIDCSAPYPQRYRT